MEVKTDKANEAPKNGAKPESKAPVNKPAPQQNTGNGTAAEADKMSAGKNGETPGRQGDSGLSAQLERLLQQNAQILAENKKLTDEVRGLGVKVASMEKGGGGERVHQIGDGPSQKGSEEIENFLHGEVRKGVYFHQESDRFMIVLEHGKKYLDDLREERTTPSLTAETTRWMGPGSELKNEFKKPLLKWGVLDLSILPEVQNGTVDLDKLCAIIESTGDYLDSGVIISYERAQQIIGSHYEHQAHERRYRESLEQNIASLPRGKEKSGVFATV